MMVVSIILLLFGIVWVIGNPLKSEDKNLNDFIESNIQFTSDLYKEVSQLASEKCFVFSPISVEEVLALVRSGSKGVTAEEIGRTLHFPEESSEIESVFQSFIPKLKANDNTYNLTLTNRIYVKDSYVVNENYRKHAKKVYSVDIENIDFKESDASVSKINEWVEKETNHQIRDLVSPGDVTDLTQLILINGMYFSGKWEKNFNDPRYTKKKTFYRNGVDKVEVDTMYVRDTLRYYECSVMDAKILELPYDGEEISMTVILPNEKNGWKKLFNFNERIFRVPNYTLEYLQVELPRFSINYTIDFKEPLQKLGIKSAFDKGDFSGFLDNNKETVSISNILQKTFINVTEEGTEAAAASSGLVASLAFVPDEEPTKYFIADHPFLFHIRSTFGILFVGHYAGH